jgi:hypothetical protein
MIATVSASKVTGALRVVHTPNDVAGINQPEVTLASVTGTWSGLPIFIYGNGHISNAQGAYDNVTFRVRLDNATAGTIVRSVITTSNAPGPFGMLPLAILTTYVPTPGPHTFFLTASTNPNAAATVANIEFGAVELVAK